MPSEPTADARDLERRLDALRDPVGAIGLAVRMLVATEPSWIGGLPAGTAARVRSILRALSSSAQEAVSVLAPAQRPALSEPDGSELAGLLRRLEILLATSGGPQVLLRVEGIAAAVPAVPPGRLVAALHAAARGVAQGRPAHDRPRAVTVRTRVRDGEIELELRCRGADDSVGRGEAAIAVTLPAWLHESLCLATDHGGSVSRGRDGDDEVVVLRLPAAANGSPPRAAAARVA